MTIVSQINAINLKFKISTIADKLLRQKQIHLYVYQYRCYNINDTTIITGCDNINDTTIIAGCDNDYFVKKQKNNKKNKTTTNK